MPLRNFIKKCVKPKKSSSSKSRKKPLKQLKLVVRPTNPRKVTAKLAKLIPYSDVERTLGGFPNTTRTWRFVEPWIEEDYSFDQINWK